MERNPIKQALREEIISDLRSRLLDLRKRTHPLDPEISVLHYALRMEERVLKAKSRDVSDYFITGYAGRRIVLWNYMDGAWDGQLCNGESGIVKREGSGKTAEEMLRHLMPNKNLTDESLVRVIKKV